VAGPRVALGRRSEWIWASTLRPYRELLELQFSMAGLEIHEKFPRADLYQGVVGFTGWADGIRKKSSS
jgi:hypothetical protein